MRLCWRSLRQSDYSETTEPTVTPAITDSYRCHYAPRSTGRWAPRVARPAPRLFALDVARRSRRSAEPPPGRAAGARRRPAAGRGAPGPCPRILPRGLPASPATRSRTGPRPGPNLRAGPGPRCGRRTDAHPSRPDARLTRVVVCRKTPATGPRVPPRAPGTGVADVVRLAGGPVPTGRPCPAWRCGAPTTLSAPRTGQSLQPGPPALSLRPATQACGRDDSGRPRGERVTWTIAIGTGLLFWTSLLTLGGRANRDRDQSWEQRQRRQYRGRHRACGTRHGAY